MTRNLLFNLTLVFILATAFSHSDDTIVKGNPKAEKILTVKEVQPLPKNVNADSLVTIAQQDVLSYNKSVEIKDKSQLQVLELNKRLLAYEKKENELIKAIIAKQKAKANKENDKKIEAVDSICSKYQRPLFGKKKCIEYTTIYTITIDAKTIKLKELK